MKEESALEGLAKAAGGVVMATGALFLMITLATVMGAVTGWTVGLIYPNTLRAGQEAIGITPLPPWQLGACLGFVGGFFRYSNASKRT
jgi:hypothetical protein